jgi:thiopeptide-type bacteriocin biosynthesis protein
VHDWTQDLRDRGLVATLVHDTYIPESGRFGPGAALEAAEAFFVADSRAVTAQITLDPTEDGMRVWAAASMSDLTHHLLADAPAARQWLIDHAPAGVTDRAEAARTITLTHPDHEVRSDPLRAAWEQRAAAARTYAKALADLGCTAAEMLPDLLHLHSTRLFGPSPETERACLALARTAAVSWNARLREHR